MLMLFTSVRDCDCDEGAHDIDERIRECEEQDAVERSVEDPSESDDQTREHNADHKCEYGSCEGNDHTKEPTDERDPLQDLDNWLE